MGGLDLILILLYFILVVGIAAWVRRGETVQDFLIGGRDLSVVETAFSVMAVFGALEIVGQSALAYNIGFSAMWFWTGIAIGIFLLGMIASRVKDHADAEDFITLPDYLHSQYGELPGHIAAVILFITFLALLTGHLIAGARLIAPLLNIDYAIAVLVLVVATLIYTALGGFRAVTKTDYLQGVIMVILFGALLFFTDVSAYTSQATSFSSIGWYDLFSFLFTGVFVIFAGADVWQRFFAAEDVDTVRKGFSLASIFVLLFGAVVTLVGVAARTNYPDIKADEALYHGFFQLLPEPVFGLGIIIMLAAVMSAIDTQVFVLSSSIAKDYYYRRSEVSEERMQHITRWSFFITAGAATLLALLISSILTVLYGLFSLMLSVSPTILGSFYFDLQERAVSLSMTTGVLALIVLAVIGKFNPNTAVITLPTAIVFLLIGQLVETYT